MDYKTLDSELLIKEIKKFPEIWNPADENYKETEKKKESWGTICKMFCKDFDEKSKDEKNGICYRIAKKWRNVRDTYKRCLRNKPTSKKYIYAKQLSFLETAGVRGEKQCSVQRAGIEKDIEQQNAQQQQKQKKESEKSSCNGENSSRKKNRHLETPLTQVMGNRIPQPVSAPDTNSDKSFFESLLPSLRDFTENEKLTLRCEILTLIRRMKESRLANNVNLPYAPSHAVMPNPFQQFPHAYAAHPNFSTNYFARTPSLQIPSNPYLPPNIPFMSNNCAPQNQTNSYPSSNHPSPSISPVIPLLASSRRSFSTPTSAVGSSSDDENIVWYKDA